MTNTKGRQNKPIEAWELAVGFSAALALCLILFSCSPAKRIEKAIQTVITDSSAFRIVGGKWTRLQPPCVSDTTVIDSTQVLILSDTVQINSTDTLNRVDTIRITNTKVNRVVSYIVDDKAIHELQDTIHALQLRQAAHSGITTQLSQDRKQAQDRADFEAKRAKRAGWLMWGILAAALISHLFRSIPSIRKAIGV